MTCPAIARRVEDKSHETNLFFCQTALLHGARKCEHDSRKRNEGRTSTHPKPQKWKSYNQTKESGAAGLGPRLLPRLLSAAGPFRAGPATQRQLAQSKFFSWPPG